jgi:hypothetical protein
VVASGGASLQFDELVRGLRATVSAFPDRRTGKNIQYSIADIALSAFSVFFLQSPSFLDFQRTMGRSKGRHNAASLFGVLKVPSDNQIRSVLDAVPAESLEPMFDSVVDSLIESGGMDEFRSIGNDLLVTLDGTEYYRSERLSCAHCHVSHHSTGRVSYKHMLVSPAIVKPGQKNVIALPPEFIRAKDGRAKAENELVAAKRWLTRHGERLSELSVTIMGDDLYASQPLLEQVREAEMSFLCVCKPQSHKYLQECVESLRGTGETETLETTEWTGKEHRRTRYEWAEDVPIRATEDAMRVGWLSVAITGEDGRRIYTNSFITNHVLTAETVTDIAEAGRARWKIENEDINTLKTKGYNLEHNFGHGNEHLSETLATLNILAFLFHTILDLTDKRYQLLRNTRGRRTRFFTELGVVACYWYHESWSEQMKFMVTQLELPDPGS